MSHNYSKKFVIPSNVTSLSTFVFGLTTLIVCDNFGIVAKKFSIILNCFESKVSNQSFSSFFVQSDDAQDSSSLKTTSIQELMISKESSTET